MHRECESVNPGLQNRVAVAERTENLKAALDEGAKEPLRIITVRLPLTLHEALKSAAHRREKSLNQHCIDLLVKLNP
jgi:predicted HicB family RNase H-like nuclease